MTWISPLVTQTIRNLRSQDKIRCQSSVSFLCHVRKENISQLKNQLKNVEETLEATRQSGKNEEHKSNQLLAEKVWCIL